MGNLSKVHSAARHSVVALGGAVFALAVSQALAMETRHAIAFVTGLLLLSLAACGIGNIPDLLLYVLAFNLSFTSIEKTFFLTDESTFVLSGVPISLADICLAGLYALWFSRIIIEKREKVPALTMLDAWVLAFLGVHVISLLNATSRTLTALEIIRLAKYSLMYFYLAHKLRRQHLKWIVAGFLFTILLQTSVALVQYRTDSLLGIGRTKGASDLNYEQYTVTGFESVSRAEGTTFDSHALGLLFAMTLPIPLAMALMQGLRPRDRVIAGAVFVLGVPGLVVSFARAAWAAFACSAAVVLVCLVIGQYRGSWRRLLLVGAAGAALAAIALLPLGGKMRQRVFEAPSALLTARIETIEMGMEMWKQSPWTGFGSNNYMRALETKYNVFEGDPYFIPVHNMVVFVMAELGVIGLTVFLALSGAIFLTNWRVARGNDVLLQSIAGALLGAFTAFHIEGLFDPIYATTVTYFTVWFQFGFGAGLYNMNRPLSIAPVQGHFC